MSKSYRVTLKLLKFNMEMYSVTRKDITDNTKYRYILIFFKYVLTTFGAAAYMYATGWSTTAHFVLVRIFKVNTSE